MDNRGDFVDFQVDLQEAMFKRALYEKNMSVIDKLINHKMLGDAQVGYLYQKKYTSLAIKMVNDVQAKFQLAIDSNNLEVAFRTCKQLQQPECFEELREESLRQGNQALVDICLIQQKKLDGLAFHHLLLGNTQKLEKIEATSLSQRFTQSLFIGNIEERIRVLCESGQLGLAYACAVTHGLAESAQEIAALIKQANKPGLLEELSKSLKWVQKKNPQALLPPSSIYKPGSKTNLISMNWPHNYLAEEQILDIQGAEDQKKLQDEIAQFSKKEDVLISKQPESLPVKQQKKIEQTQEEEIVADEGGAWGLDEEEEEIIEEQPKQVVSPITDESLDLIALKQGIPSEIFKKASNSQLCREQFAIGNIDQALEILNRQIALSNRKALSPGIQAIIRSQMHLVDQIPFIAPQAQYILDEEKELVLAGPSINEIRQLVKNGYKSTTEGKFNETLQTFQQVLQKVVLIKASSKEEEDELKSIICQSANYILAMKCELAKKRQADNQERVLELGCYMACFQLQPTHRTLTLRAAMSLAYKMKNMITAAVLAKKLLNILENAPANSNYAKPDVIQNTKKILSAGEKIGTNALNINFDAKYLDDQNFLEYINSSKLVITQNQRDRCPLDRSYDEKNTLCSVCELCNVGSQTLGIKLFQS